MNMNMFTMGGTYGCGGNIPTTASSISAATAAGTAESTSK